jgi:hypothetical protein
LKKFTVTQLKDWLKSQDVKFPSKWKKDELLKKVEEVLNSGNLKGTTSADSTNNNNNNTRDDIRDDDEEEQQLAPKKKQKTTTTTQKKAQIPDDDIESSPTITQPKKKQPAPRPGKLSKKINLHYSSYSVYHLFWRCIGRVVETDLL